MWSCEVCPSHTTVAFLDSLWSPSSEIRQALSFTARGGLNDVEYGCFEWKLETMSMPKFSWTYTQSLYSFCNRRLWWRSFANIWSVSGAFAVQLVHFSHLAWRCSFFSLDFWQVPPYLSPCATQLKTFHVLQAVAVEVPQQTNNFDCGIYVGTSVELDRCLKKEVSSGVASDQVLEFVQLGLMESLGMCWRRRGGGFAFAWDFFFCVCRIMSLCLPFTVLEVKPPSFGATVTSKPFSIQVHSYGAWVRPI